MLPRAGHALQHAAEHREGGVEHGRVLAQHVRRGERVQRYGALPSGFPPHQAPQPGESAVVEGGVVRVAGDAVAVEGDEHVDGGGGCAGVLVAAAAAAAAGLLPRWRRLRGAGLEGARHHGGELGGVPRRGHAVGEGGVLDHEDVVGAAETEEEGGARELGFADGAEPVGVACSQDT